MNEFLLIGFTQQTIDVEGRTFITDIFPMSCFNDHYEKYLIKHVCYGIEALPRDEYLSKFVTQCGVKLQRGYVDINHLEETLSLFNIFKGCNRAMIRFKVNKAYNTLVNHLEGGN